jgi:RimJ/RimL family protein N-acetyltransferase
VVTGPVLRRPTADDVPGIHAVHADPHVYELDPQETHPDLAHTEEWMQPILAHWDRFGFGYWTVLVPSAWWPDGVPSASEPGHVVAGLGGIRVFAWGARPDGLPRPGSGETVLNVYTHFSPQVHGRGLGGLVLAESLRSAAVHRPDLDLVVRTRPANAAIKRVARRAGFVDDGLDADDRGMFVLRHRAVGSPDT